MKEERSLVPSAGIENAIQFLRRQRVILSFHLAEMYGVETKVLVRAVKRNSDRFPSDFMFQLTSEEWKSLRCQFGTLETGRGQHPKYLPYAFSEQGVAMLSTVLNSSKAIHVNIEVMRAFVRMRGMLISNADLARRIDELEKKYDKHFAVVFEAIRQLMEPAKSPNRRSLGFVPAKVEVDGE
jgi:phage regulator Rha-like protein